MLLSELVFGGDGSMLACLANRGVFNFNPEAMVEASEKIRIGSLAEEQQEAFDKICGEGTKITVFTKDDDADKEKRVTSSLYRGIKIESENGCYARTFSNKGNELMIAYSIKVGDIVVKERTFRNDSQGFLTTNYECYGPEEIEKFRDLTGEDLASTTRDLTAIGISPIYKYVGTQPYKTIFPGEDGYAKILREMLEAGKMAQNLLGIITK